MEDLQSTLRSILSDPEQMARVAALAESLGLKPPDEPQQGEGARSGQAKPCPEQAQRGGEGSVPASSVPNMNGFDPEKLMVLLSASSGAEDRVLNALRPSLSPESGSRIDRALRAAKLSRLAARLLAGRGEGRV